MYERALGAQTSNDRALFKASLDQLIGKYPLSSEGVSALYLRARGYEDGLFVDGIRLDLALEDFATLNKATAGNGSMVLVGLARVLYQQDPRQHTQEILDLCQQAIKVDSNTKAMMLLGLVYENVFDNYRAARRWYLKAFLKGLPWGMRYCAYSLAREEKQIMAFLCHSIATIASPLLIMKNGVVPPFH